jgi:hypothetical protein
MSEDNFIELPVQEFGRVVTTTAIASEELTEQVRAIAQADADSFKKAMECIRDVRWVKEPQVMLGPVVDKLQRFRPIGWHGLLASADYYVLSDYFKTVHVCRKEHVPEEINFRYVLSTFNRWLKSRKANKHEEDWDE